MLFWEPQGLALSGAQEASARLALRWGGRRGAQSPAPGHPREDSQCHCCSSCGCSGAESGVTGTPCCLSFLVCTAGVILVPILGLLRVHWGSGRFAERRPWGTCHALCDVVIILATASGSFLPVLSSFVHHPAARLSPWLTLEGHPPPTPCLLQREKTVACLSEGPRTPFHASPFRVAGGHSYSPRSLARPLPAPDTPPQGQAPEDH